MSLGMQMPRPVGMDVAMVVQYINSQKEGCITIADLGRFLGINKVRDIESFISNNEDNFKVKNEGQLSIRDQVWVKTALKLCEVHCRKNKICTGTCAALHVCRNYLLKGHDSCPFYKGKKSCSFGHNLRNAHNGLLLQIHNLNRMKDLELQTLFRRRTCRSLSTMPQVCLYYNDRRGNRCSNKNCKSLHFCMDHLRGVCVMDCHRSHQFSTSHNTTVLDLFAFDQTWTEEALLEDLRQVMEYRHVSDNNPHDSGSHYDSDTDDDYDDDDQNRDDNDVRGMGGASAFQGKLLSAKKLSASRTSLKSGADLCCGQCCKHNQKLFQQFMEREGELQARVENLEAVVEEFRSLLKSKQQRRQGQTDIQNERWM